MSAVWIVVAQILTFNTDRYSGRRPRRIAFTTGGDPQNLEPCEVLDEVFGRDSRAGPLKLPVVSFAI